MNQTRREMLGTMFAAAAGAGSLEERLPSVQISESALVASITLESFYDFVQEFWSTVIPEKPVWNWHIRFLCDRLQYHAENVFAGRDKEADPIINIPPGTTKSTICSVMFPAWCLARNPAMRLICGSHTDTLVLDLSSRCRNVVKSEKFQASFGVDSERPEELKVILREDQDTKGYWATTRGGFRFSCTVGGKSPTGFHGHFLIVDDPIDPQKVLSEAEVKEANDWMANVISSRKVDSRIALTILIMQRLHQNDPTGNRLLKAEAGTIEHICLPAELSDIVHPPELRKHYADGLLDPSRLPQKVLQEKLATMGEFGFSGQYRQWPVPLGGGMFKTDRIKFAVAPKVFKRIVRFWDKAGTKDGNGAYTAGVKMALDMDGRFWVLDVIRGRWESFERETIIKRAAQMDTKIVSVGLEQEPGSGGKESAQATIRNLAGFRVRADKPTGDKAARADPLSVQVNAGNLYIADGAPWALEFVAEMQFFPVSTYKDQIDAASGAFNILTKAPMMVGAL